MFTSHGHQIPYTPAVPRPEHMSVMRCGGLTLCAQCKAEYAAAAEALKLPPIPNAGDSTENQLKNGLEDAMQKFHESMQEAARRLDQLRRDYDLMKDRLKNDNQETTPGSDSAKTDGL